MFVYMSLILIQSNERGHGGCVLSQGPTRNAYGETLLRIMHEMSIDRLILTFVISAM